MCGFRQAAFGPQAAMRPCMERDGGCADFARRVRTAGRSGTKEGRGGRSADFAKRRSDRRPQWYNVRGRKGDVRISPEAFGPQAAVVQCTGKERGCADFAKGVRTAGRSGTMDGEGWGMCGFRQVAFGPQAAMVQCMGRDGGGADFAIGVRTAGRSGTMDGEGWGMCGFRQVAFGPQAAMVQSMGKGRGCADFARGVRTAGRSGSMYGEGKGSIMHNTIMEGWR